MESLRQQLADARGRGEEEERQSAEQLTQLQTDTGRLSKELAGKVRRVEGGVQGEYSNEIYCRRSRCKSCKVS